MNLFQRTKDGPWYVRFRHPANGRDTWRSTHTTDRETAELIGKAIEVKLARQKFGIEDVDSRRHIPISEFAKIYTKYSRTNKAPATAKKDQNGLRFFAEIVGDKLITEVEPLDFEYFKTEGLRRWSERTVNTYLICIKGAFRRAVQWGHLKENPGSSIQRISVPESPPKYLSDEEIERLLAADQAWRIRDRQFGRVIRFFLLTGLRDSELRHLEWTDVNLRDQLIHVRNKSTFRTKTGQERAIPISPALLRLIQEIGPKAEGLVFESPQGGTYGDGVWRRKMKRRVQRASLNNAYSLHTLRHTFATHLRDKGVGLDVIAELLGHSQLETTRMYGHLTPRMLRDTVALLDW